MGIPEERNKAIKTEFPKINVRQQTIDKAQRIRINAPQIYTSYYIQIAEKSKVKENILKEARGEKCFIYRAKIKITSEISETTQSEIFKVLKKTQLEFCIL